MSLEGIEIFVEIVDAQSFSRAAKRLNMPATTVSASFARLEARLGISLIQRTTRKLHVTPTGQRYYDHCVRALAQLSEGASEIASAREEPSGPLRLTAPPDLMHGLLTPFVERYLQLYPKASVDLVVTNQRLDLVAEGIDLAVRIGPQADSSLVTRKFRSARVGLWASADYLARLGTPGAPDDLKGHDFVRFSRAPPTIEMKSVRTGTAVIDLSGRLGADDMDTLRRFIERGQGIGTLPIFASVDAIADDSLVRVLPGYAMDFNAVHFAYPAQRFVPPTVRAFIALATGEAYAAGGRPYSKNANGAPSP